MSDEKKYTERDLILAKREGYVRHCNEACGQWSEHAMQKFAESAYPLPKVTRARVVKDPMDGSGWAVKDGMLQWTYDATARMCIIAVFDEPAFWSKYRPTPARIRLWADLLANPTEEVDT